MIQQSAPTLSLLSERLREELNRLRSDPRSFIEYLQNKLRFYRDTLLFLEDRPESAIRTSEGDKAPRQLIEELGRLEPLPPIQHSVVLQKAAERHAKDLGQNGKYSHQGADGSSFEDRVARYGKWKGHLVQVLECGYRQPRDILASLLIDDGMPTRPHRKTLLNREVHFQGICIHTHSIYEYITVMVFSSEEPTTDRDSPSKRDIFTATKARNTEVGESAWRPDPITPIGNRSTSVVMERPSLQSGQGHCECTLF